MDFSAWAEVFLNGRWYTIDARHNHPRIGRIVMGRGRDAGGRRDIDRLWDRQACAF
jgi:transglutaminase-like putative cysteine protease